MRVCAAEEVGMSSERLRRKDAYLEREVADDRLPGIIALAQRRGKIIHHSLHGKMDIEAERAMEADAIFRIYSMTKPVISLAVMQLHDEGRLQLFDPVSRYIPSFGKTKVYSHMRDKRVYYVDQDPPLTTFHLLTHTAGLTYSGDPWHPVDEQFREAAEQMGFFRRDMQLSDLIQHIADLPLKFQPGSDWQYSVAVDVLGHLVQIIADRPLAEFLKERILAPLGMDDTDFFVPAEKAIGWRQFTIRRRTMVPSSSNLSVSQRAAYANRRLAPPVAADWYRQWRTICDSLPCCSRAASLMAFGLPARRPSSE